MAAFTIREVKQLLLVLDSVPANLRPSIPVVRLHVNGSIKLKWWLDINMPGWREAQTQNEGMFGKR